MILILLLGLINPKIMLVFIICIIAPLLTGKYTGRFWCGFLCPIGSFFDNITIKLSNNKKAPNLFKSKYIRIIFTTLMMSMFVFEMISAFGNPHKSGMVFYGMILEAVIIGSFLAVIYHHRAWCHFCPMGSTGSLVTFYSRQKKVLSVTKDCTSCKTCESICPMGLSASDFKGKLLDSADCIQCGICKNNCPSKAIKYRNDSVL